MIEIIPELWFSNLDILNNISLIKDKNIKIIILCGENKNIDTDSVNICYFYFTSNNKINEPILKYINNYVDKLYKLLINCNNILIINEDYLGYILLISYIIKYGKLSLPKVLECLKDKFLIDLDNQNFLIYLQQYEKNIELLYR